LTCFKHFVEDLDKWAHWREHFQETKGLKENGNDKKGSYSRACSNSSQTIMI